MSIPVTKEEWQNEWSTLNKNLIEALDLMYKCESVLNSFRDSRLDVYRKCLNVHRISMLVELHGLRNTFEEIAKETLNNES